MSPITVNNLGLAVARSGLLPASAHYFTDYLRTHGAELRRLLPTAAPATRGPAEVQNEPDALDTAFLLAHLCFTSPEFGGEGVDARRQVPYQLGVRHDSARGRKLNDMLAVRPWDRDVLAVNAADITMEWIAGTPILELEQRFTSLRAGVLRDMFRTLVSHLTALADITAAMIVASDADQLDANYAWVKRDRGVLFRMVRRAKQVARCTVRGVPEDMLWLAELHDTDSRPLCRRPEIIACLKRGVCTVDDVVDAGRTLQLISALKDVGSVPERWKAIRTGAIDYRVERTERRKTSQRRRLGPKCDDTVGAFYASRGVPFEEVLARCFTELAIEIVGRDDTTKRGSSYPDFVIELCGRRIVIECKSTEGTKDVPLGEASDVFRKSGIHNLASEHLVTVCQPYVSTDVPRKIEASDRLTVINAEDLGEALVRLHLKRLSPERFVNWLTTPGQSRYEDLL